MDLLEKTVEMRDARVINRRTYRAVVWQRRLMAVATACTIGSVLPLIVALATPNWAIIDFYNTDLEQVHVQLGVWGEWRTITNHSNIVVEWVPHFPQPPAHLLRLANTELNHYYRAQAVFGVGSLLLLLSNNALAINTFYQHRYMYKRLVAALYTLTAMCLVVTIEVLTNSVNEWNTAVASQHEDWDYGAGQRLGYSTMLAWCVFVVLCIAAIVFALSSHKQKGSRAATAEFEIEDRPVHIGR